MKGHMRTAVVAALIGAFAAAGTVALAGSGVGGVFNLGQGNSVNAQTLLTEVGKSVEERFGKMNPECGGVHFLLGHRQVACADVFQREELHLLESDDLPVHADVSV